jgi:hypothetical protein
MTWVTGTIWVTETTWVMGGAGIGEAAELQEVKTMSMMIATMITRLDE